ncbi:RNA-directed DNA polymerase [Hydrogenimonas sp.]
MIYEFIDMTEDDLPSVAYRYNYIVRSDVKNFYPSIYTHSIAWAIHGKKKIRKGGNRYDYTLLGNRLDKLFQNANDGRTNGLPIGPVVSDIVAEAILSSVDRVFSKLVKDALIDCEAVRFKDDYRILVKSYEDAKKVVKYLQKAFGAYHLELSEEKTRIDSLPNGLYREWVSKYHAVHPRKRSKYSWKQFRELYLAVLKIDREHPGTGVIDRFLADIVSKKGHLKIKLNEKNLEKIISMLLMLGDLRVKAFPKILAIVESVLRSHIGKIHKDRIIGYLSEFLEKLSLEEERNKYLIAWLSYFFVSNGYEKRLKFKPKYKDPIIRAIMSNRPGKRFKKNEFVLFEGCRKSAKRVTMLQHLEVFASPPKNG